MNLGKLYHWFYCLPLPRAVLLCVMGCAGVLWVRNRWHTRSRWHWLCGGILVIWAAVVIHLTLLGRSPDPELTHSLRLFDSYRVWLREGNREMIRSNFMNLALFLPGGLLLAQLMPRQWPRWKRLLPALALMMLLSICIEWVQAHFLLGQAEADDVLHNTLGAALGIMADVVFPAVNETA